MKLQGFPKREHLCLKRDIDQLFSAGSKAVTVFPIRAVYREVERAEGPAAKVLVSVAKRRFHHAVDRNRVKRQLREAYRREKGVIVSACPETSAIHVAFIWLSDQLLPSAKVHASMRTILHRIAENITSAKAEPAQPTNKEGEE